MKKITSILAAAMCIVLAVSCGQKKSAEAQEVAPEKTQAEIYAEQEIMVHLDSLASELVKINPIGIVGSVKDGKVVLSDKEKQVKPDYLPDPAVVKDMQTLINQIANGTAKSEPSNLGHNTLDTYFRLNNATIVWNKSQAEEWARKMKK